MESSECRCNNVTLLRVSLMALNAMLFIVAIALTILLWYADGYPVLARIKLMNELFDYFVLLILIAALGCVAVYLTNQTVLYVYIVLMMPIFLVHLAGSCFCLSSDTLQQDIALEAGWHRASSNERAAFQLRLHCCGLRDAAHLTDPLGHPGCQQLDCCAGSSHPCCTGNTTASSTAAAAGSSCPCHTDCLSRGRRRFNWVVKVIGTIGLVVTVLDAAAIILAINYRNLLNPRSNFTKMF